MPLPTSSSSPGRPRGIGAVTARIAQARGARVILHGRTESDELIALATELQAPFVTADAGDSVAVATAVEQAAAAYGRLDVLINNAGGTSRRTVLSEATDDEWRAALELNLLGPVRFIRTAIPHLRSSGGCIVNVGSITARRDSLLMPLVPMGAAKAALDNFSAALAVELAPIRVNSVMPGYTATYPDRLDTPFWRAGADRTLLGRIGDPAEVAEVVLFLAGQGGRYVTGQTWVVDGGYGLGPARHTSLASAI